MRVPTFTLALCAVLVALSTSANSRNPLPTPDFKDFAGYIRALQASDAPKARAILQSGRPGCYLPGLPHYRTCGSAYGGSRSV
jgi:hypothetical protein